VLIRPHAVEVYQGSTLIQEFNKASDRKEPEFLDAQCTFGATDPLLPSPVSFGRGLSGHGTAAAAGAQPSPSASAGAAAASGASGGCMPASSPAAQAQACQSLSKGAGTASADNPGGTGSFVRDLRDYEQVTGGFSTCSAI
jgi:hypothetical protein